MIKIQNGSKPPWLKKRIPPFEDLEKVKRILDSAKLHTVCEEARCPNFGECFSKGTATILILGRVCTRNCGFCAIEHGVSFPPMEEEPEKVAQAVKQMGLHYVVITSVTRDDLPDGGASHYAKTIRAVRALNREIRVEVLIPDFQGDLSSLITVLREGPDVLNHNIETIPRLYPEARPQADYRRSLNLLKRTKERGGQTFTKSGFMLGLGETEEEVSSLLHDLRAIGCDFLTIGQYLQPRPDRLPVARYVPPQEFEAYKRTAEEMGFKSVASGPFVRSSFHAAQMFSDCPP
ncbi:MAG TPA: lipoyl synthase [Thermodesulfobacteriota bacterium]|nr:lipoyl synthase [Thermodesulfobacteriota bacterium]